MLLLQEAQGTSVPQLFVQQLQAAEGNPGQQALLLQLLKLSLAQAALPQPAGAPQPTVCVCACMPVCTYQRPIACS